MNQFKETKKSQPIREKLHQGRTSPLSTYIDLTVGQVGLFRFLLYEFLTFFLGPMPGGLGIFLRRKLYPIFIKQTGVGLIIGRNVVLRHPDKIFLGDNVIIDDNCYLDARGAGEKGIWLGNEVLLNRNCLVTAKTGSVKLGERTSIGSNSVIVSLSGVEIGEATLAAGGVYISAGAYHFEDGRRAIMDQGAYSRGPIHIGPHSWLGTGVIVLDGIRIGQGAVIGAGAVVTNDVPDFAIAIGVPAKVHRIRVNDFKIG